MHAQHLSDGLVISGGFAVAPRFDAEERELLTTLAVVSLRAAIQEVPSTLLDRIAPGHPDGPSGWVTCEEGCCLELDEGGFTRVDAIEPWLRFMVGTLFTDHDFDGTVVMWDCADRDFTALSVEGTRVRRRRILNEKGSRRSRARKNGAGALRSV